MASFRIGQQFSDIRVYDTLGQDAKDVESFVGHIGLATGTVEVNEQQVVLAKMVEMCPPLIVPKPDEATDSDWDRIDVVGSIELTAAESKQVAIFIEETAKELDSIPKRHQYNVHPHFLDRQGPDTVRRYSCAGYVQQAYEYADIDLVDITAIPDVGLETILPAYSDSREELEHPRARRFVGLKGDGPWPVLLPGDIFHSMNRAPQDCRTAPYKPKVGDEYFPRRESAELAIVDM